VEGPLNALPLHCKTPGHTPGDKACDVYTEADPNIIAFSGQDNILSNFHLNEITVFGVEHYYINISKYKHFLIYFLKTFA
jgi:hypothetical protein